MSATSAIQRGRVAAEALMVDACTVKRQTPSSNKETGVVTYTSTTLYTGKCKVQQRTPATTPTDVGEAAVYIGQLELHLPTSVTAAQPDDLVTITASALDSDLVGKTFKLRGPVHKSFLTARRFPMAEVAG